MSINGKKVLVVIPARGGSKGIPRKNLVEFLGKPLLVHTLELAQTLQHADKIIISTDDPQIKAVAKKHQMEVLDREAHLAQDDSKMSELLADIVSRKEFDAFDLLVLLQPTSPLRKKSTVERAIENFSKKVGEYSSLMPLRAVESKIGEIVHGTYKPLFDYDQQRQEMKELYAECGTVFVYDCHAIKAREIFRKVYPFLISSEEEGVDIDTEEDLITAERFVRMNKTNEGEKKR